MGSWWFTTTEEISEAFSILSLSAFREMREKATELDMLRASIKDLLDACVELLIVASLRGDNYLPHPSADNCQWTARMQTAWDELYQIVEMLSPDKVETGIIIGRRHER